MPAVILKRGHSDDRRGFFSQYIWPWIYSRDLLNFTGSPFLLQSFIPQIENPRSAKTKNLQRLV